MMSSLYIGATGMKTQGEGMSVVTNNLSNVNTVGFKQTMAMYQDMTSQDVMARSNFITNISQQGAGAFLGETRKIFTQGGFEAGSAATDIGIEGLGFFGVTKNGLTEYTRAGNFRFTKEGSLNDPSGWTVMGRIFRNGVEGKTAEPIELDFGTGPGGLGRIDGKATENLSAYMQLGGLADKHADPANPYFSMASAWDGTQSPPLASFGYREPLTIYDNQGNARQGFIYYDYGGQKSGSQVMEYVVGIDPTEDAGNGGSPGSGLLMAGTMTFGPCTQLTNVTGFNFSGSDPTNLSSYTAAPLVNGAPAFTVNYSGSGPQTVGLDMGLTLSGSSSAGFATASDAAAAPDALFDAATGAVRKSRASTGYGTIPAESFSSNDGYGEGYLRDLTVSKDGLLSGSYSNGETLDLARVSLYRFTSQDGLHREGANHFSATAECGQIQEGVPGTENFGTLSEWSLEQSNVDYAREFTTMIITQRGFQMNSKVVTTSDQMLQKALELKR